MLRYEVAVLRGSAYRREAWFEGGVDGLLSAHRCFVAWIPWARVGVEVVLIDWRGARKVLDRQKALS